MATEVLGLPVGKRGLEDRIKINLPGTLVKPFNRSDTLFLFVTGVTGHHQDYVVHFAEPLGQFVNVYVAEIRKRGLCRASVTLDDIFQIDRQVRDRAEVSTVIYAGHSMGVNLVVASHEKYHSIVQGFYDICPYPSYGDAFTRNPDFRKRSFQQRCLELVGKTTQFGPLAYPLRNATVSLPMRFAIAGNDEVVHTEHPDVLERFTMYFNDRSRFPQGSLQVFYGRGHCFNFQRGDYKPFNKDQPQELINDVVAFISSLS